MTRAAEDLPAIAAPIPASRQAGNLFGEVKRILSYSLGSNVLPRIP